MTFEEWFEQEYPEGTHWRPMIEVHARRAWKAGYNQSIEDYGHSSECDKTAE